MGNFGQRWTSGDVAIFNARTKGASPQEKFDEAKAVVKQANAAVAAQKPKKALLNKLESAWAARLRTRQHKFILEQAITFRLGDRLTYRPDFVTIDDRGRLTCWECKGPHRYREKGLVKLKAAAHQYPFITWVLVERENGVFRERIIGT